MTSLRLFAAPLLIVSLAACSDDAGAPISAGDAAIDAAPEAHDAAVEGGEGNDADVPEAAADAAPDGCGNVTSSRFTCTADGRARAKCEGGTTPIVEACARGCLRAQGDADATCMGTDAAWSCTGSYGKTKAASGDYFLTAFGCWRDAQGGEHTDPGDNCVPSCLDEAKAEGLCAAGESGRACEERLTWYTADAARFGCLARVRITNPANGASVVAVALDYGPACSVESSVDHAVLDASGRVDRQLFGGDRGAVDRALVHVVEVDRATPLGPE